ncbi:MAG: 23S rRNA (pseudouridine(1915)-N(3))-methyltransferase RlmH [Pseudomonadales bacterium]
MKIRLLAVAARPPGWVVEGFTDYARRLPRELPLELVEIAPVARKNAAPDRAMAAEGQRILNKIGSDDWVVALDVRGESCSTEQLARKLESWRMQGRNVAILIGGADGLDPACLARADERLSLSAMTLPHALVRVVIAEQLYRAWSVLAGHPYHRG